MEVPGWPEGQIRILGELFSPERIYRERYWYCVQNSGGIIASLIPHFPLPKVPNDLQSLDWACDLRTGSKSFPLPTRA